jgi:crotonobetainyl-CoA:carnitine CoA-transferase CaiB-like acyl-CoA transferase
MTSKEASDLINGLGGISVKFHDYAEVLAHPQLAHLSPTVTVSGAAKGEETQIGTPFQFEGGVVANPSPHPAPALDADRAAIMQSIRPHLQVTR